MAIETPPEAIAYRQHDDRAKLAEQMADLKPEAMCTCGYTLRDHDLTGCLMAGSTCRRFRLKVPPIGD